jgi:hypothetical protein
VSKALAFAGQLRPRRPNHPRVPSCFCPGRARALVSWDVEAPAWQRVAAQLRAQLALQQAAGVSKRLVVESPWAQLASERQRC